MIKNGALKILRIGDVDVFVHWSWLIILYILSTGLSDAYTHKGWIAADIAAYILIIAVHETVQIIVGRLLGGRATEMYLAFFGRSSNLELPQRPWPIIITVSAGILAYLLTLGGAIAFFYLAFIKGTWGTDPGRLSAGILFVNILLAVGSVVPVYPLEGGRVLQAVLWLFMSRKRSLQAACIIGVPISLGLIALSIYLCVVYGVLFFTVIWTVLIFFMCLGGFKQAKVFDMLERMPRRTDVSCPHCRQHPFEFTMITCPCGVALDPFLTRGLCEKCGSSTSVVDCPVCSQRSAIHAWFGARAGFEIEPSSSAAVKPPPDGNEVVTSPPVVGPNSSERK